MSDDVVPRTFRALAESAERKFARVRDLPAHVPNPPLLHKVFKAYLRLWKYQQEHRPELLASVLQRWEIGEIASRIGQLYSGQYFRTSQARFLFEAYIFYEAILNRRYFDKGEDRGVRFKELRFHARFLVVALLLDRREMAGVLVERFQALVDDSFKSFPDTNFKEWKLVLQEILRFLKADIRFTDYRPLRYCAKFDSHPSSFPYVARFHAKKLLKFRDAVLTSYHRNEVKFAEITLDTYRMLQCLEWEPSGSSFPRQQQTVPRDNGAPNDYSASSGLIDINLAADMTDPNLPPNPRKAILYRSSVTQLISVIAMICEALPPESVMLIHISASGKPGHTNSLEKEGSGALSKPLNAKIHSHTSQGKKISFAQNHVNEKGNSVNDSEDGLWLGPNKGVGSNWLYPGDIIPFTRRPLFLVIDSDNSHAFKAGSSWCRKGGISCPSSLPFEANRHWR